MRSKSELQTILKEKYAINKNISQPLSAEDCERLLILLGQDQSAAKLVDSFIDKNSDLSQRNRRFGQQRGQAQKKLERLQVEYAELEQSINTLSPKQLLEERERLLKQNLELNTRVSDLADKNKSLDLKTQQLSSDKDELVEANTQLKKDNKALKNIVDRIKLQLAQDTQALLQYEDSEIRKAMIRLFRWTLG